MTEVLVAGGVLVYVLAAIFVWALCRAAATDS
jgi:hypothetical protein